MGRKEGARWWLENHRHQREGLSVGREPSHPTQPASFPLGPSCKAAVPSAPSKTPTCAAGGKVDLFSVRSLGVPRASIMIMPCAHLQHLQSPPHLPISKVTLHVQVLAFGARESLRQCRWPSRTAWDPLNYSYTFWQPLHFLTCWGSSQIWGVGPP